MKKIGEDIEYDYSKLDGRIREKFKSRENLVQNISISTTSLNLRMTNRLEFTQKDIQELTKVLEIPSDEISEYFFTQKVRKTQPKEGKGI